MLIVFAVTTPPPYTRPPQHQPTKEIKNFKYITALSIPPMSVIKKTEEIMMYQLSSNDFLGRSTAGLGESNALQHQPGCSVNFVDAQY